MPEIITKYPDVTRQVLESAGAKCGAGEPQRILTQCPRERFCALPGGEICIYGLGDISAMTQVRKAELCGTTSGAGTLADLGGAVGLPALALAVVVATWRRRRPVP